MSPDGLHMVDFMRKFDFGVCATARYRVNGRSGIDFSYLQSFTGIYKPKNVVDGNTYVIDSKYNPVNLTFQISLFYLFF
jgi:lysozyme family protein